MGQGKSRIQVLGAHPPSSFGKREIIVIPWLVHFFVGNPGIPIFNKPSFATITGLGVFFHPTFTSKNHRKKGDPIIPSSPLGLSSLPNLHYDTRISWLKPVGNLQEGGLEQGLLPLKFSRWPGDPRGPGTNPSSERTSKHHVFIQSPNFQ